MRKKKERVMEQTVTVSYTYTRRVRLEEKTCPQCGKTFEGVTKRKYCRRACQAKADYERNATTYRTNRMARYRREQKQGPRK